MSMDIRYPNITAKDSEAQLLQVKSYLHQLVDQLNWALKNVESGASESDVYVNTSAAGGGGADAKSKATFNSVKALIMKSADIVNAYYQEINHRLEGVYVAESDFGVYVEQTAQEIEANSASIDLLFTNLQQIITDIEGLEHTVIEVEAHIRPGLLYYADDGSPVYGLEIGQKTEINGVEIFNQFARFTAEKLSFYDSNGIEVAYISDKKLYITHIEVTGSFTQGGFVDTVLADRSLVTKWIERG